MAEYEKTIKEEDVSIENVAGIRFLNSSVSIGEEVVGRRNGRLYTYGWIIENPDEDWNGVGPLGVRIDEEAFKLRRELKIIDGYGEWIPEVTEGEDNG